MPSNLVYNQAMPELPHDREGQMPEKTAASTTRLRQTNGETHDPREAYQPYPFGRRERHALGRERTRFEEWEQMSFSEFLTHKDFLHPEAVIGYFVDHPDANVHQELKELFLDKQYDQFVQTHFRSKTILNPRGLAQEIETITKQIMAKKLELAQQFQRVEEDQKESYRSAPRIAYIPLAFTVDVTETRIRLNSQVDPNTKLGGTWEQAAQRSYLHESEHIRVFSHYKVGQDAIAAGFKKLPNNRADIHDGVLSQTDKDHDEGMTECIALWKQLILEGMLTPNSSTEEILTLLEHKITRSSYPHATGEVLRDMRVYQAYYSSLNKK